MLFKSTYQYKNYNNIWLQLLYAFTHPIDFIKTFKDEMYAWPSLPERIKNLWDVIYKYLPLQKACRWLGNELIGSVYDSKLLDDFYCRTRGKITKYYTAKCNFGRFKFIETTYERDGKTINTFMDITVTTLVDQEQGKKNAESTVTTNKTIYSGWVFTKKKAFKLYRQIVLNNLDIFGGEDKPHPEVHDPYKLMHIDDMYSILETGKIKHYSIDAHYLDKLFTESKDRYVKLWAYLTNMLFFTGVNTNIRNEIADLARDCDYYTFAKERLKDPETDYYYKNLIKEKKEKQAKKYMSLVRKDSKQDIKRTADNINEKLTKMKEIVMNEPYDYYRA